VLVWFGFIGFLFQHVDILHHADVLQDIWPNNDRDFSKLGLAQYQHEGARLPYAATDAEGNFVLQNGLMLGEFHEIHP
jgi:hypothetical protein